MEGVPVPVVFVTCNSFRESRVLEFGNFPCATPEVAVISTLEAWVFVTTMLVVMSELVFTIVFPAVAEGPLA